MGRTPCCSKVGLHRGAWSADEDKLLINHIQTHGEGQWRSLPSKAGLLRCGKSCRLRWMNYLRPGIKRGNFTTEENDAIIRLRSLHGNRWSLIATELPGRTDNDIKNHWNAHLRKLTETASNHHRSKPRENKTVKNKKKKKIMKLDDQKAKTTSQQKSTEVKVVDSGHTPSSSLSSSTSSKNEGASSSCTIGFEDVDFDFDFDFSRSKWTPLLEVEDECFLMDDYDVILEKDDERLMLENLYDEYLNLLNHQDVD